MPPNEAPGLAIGLGGVGITLKDLVQLYAGLANRGQPMQLGDGIQDKPGQIEGEPLLEPVAAWNVADILSGVMPPAGAGQRGIAYKTGTSYGYRDAWSVGFDGRYVLGVWVGRPDNGAVPGPDRLWLRRADPVRRLCQVRRCHHAAAARARWRRAHRAGRSCRSASGAFRMNASGLLASSTREPAPQIVYPPEGARVELGATTGGDIMPLGAEAAGRPGAVPLARQRQAAAGNIAPPRQPMGARWWRLFDADGHRLSWPGSQCSRICRLNWKGGVR